MDMHGRDADNNTTECLLPNPTALVVIHKGSKTLPQ